MLAGKPVGRKILGDDDLKDDQEDDHDDHANDHHDHDFHEHEHDHGVFAQGFFTFTHPHHWRLSFHSKQDNVCIYMMMKLLC